ncbi:hypothetical protein Tco_1319698 [Tanacetum coccineum]
MESKDTLSSCSNSEEQQMQQLHDRAKESCMVSFRQLHSHLKLLSNNDLNGTRTEYGFKRTFATLFGQDVEIFTGTMFLNMDQLDQQLDKEEFQEIGSMAAFKVLETQFQMFIKSRIYMDDEYVVMTRNYFLEYTRLDIPEFCDTLIQNMDYVKKSIDKRALHKKEYDRWVNERQMQTTEGKVDTCKTLDAGLVIIESNGTESNEQDTSNRSRNDAHVDDANIRPIYDEEPMDEVQLTAECNVFAIGPQLIEQCHDTSPLLAKLTDNQTTELSNQSLESENECLKKTVSQFQKDFAKLKAYCINLEIQMENNEKGFAIAALKNELRKLTGNSVNTKFAKPSILGKPVLHPHRNHSVVRQPTAFKSERPTISKPRFASQVDVNNNLSKSVTTHYLPKGKESAVVKPHHMIALSSSRYSSNDMVHNHYLEEAKKKTQEKDRNSRNFSDSKHFVCSTCQKCVFNANHDSCVTKFLNEVNSRAKVPSDKTTNRNKPIEQISVAKKQERQILKGHRFSIKKATIVNEKTITPRSCLRWKPTGRIFKTVGLRWVPTGKIFASSITKVDSEPTHGSNVDISHIHACKQTLDLSAGTSFNGQKQQRIDLSAGALYNVKQENLRQMTFEQISSGLGPQRQMMSDHNNSGLDPQCSMTSDHHSSELEIHDHNNEPSSSKLVPKVVHPADKTATSRQVTRWWRYPIPAKVDSLPHAHAQTAKTYYTHQDTRIKKAQELKTKSFANSDINDLPQRYQDKDCQGRLLASFQNDAKYEHVGQVKIARWQK